jgi:glycosyltransferase involved in cell wall biosynthesis
MTGDHSLRDRRIVLVSNTSWYLWNFRGDTIRALIRLGAEVTTVAPEDAYRERLEGLGAAHVVWRFDRRSVAPWTSLGPLRRLRGLYRRLSPDVVHHFTIKPVILGGIAARLERVPGIVQSVPGLGLAFAESNVLHVPALLGYRLALGGRARTIFQNADDMERLIASGVAARERSVLIRSSGVDVERLGAVSHPADSGAASPARPITFLMACRMLWAKGVREYAEAAAALHNRGMNARFVLLGDPDEGNPDAVPRDWLENLRLSGDVEWRGFQDDVTGELAEADVVILPSYYGEGVPKSLLEGGAAGRALVAADAPGSRDVVIDTETGLLVPPKDGTALAEAMEKLIRDPELRQELGRRAQELVRAEFSSDAVVDRTIEVYESALAEGSK